MSGDRRAGWHEFDIDGFEVFIGRSARDNDELTFRVARPRDIWLHAAGHAGSHVVIRVPDEADEVPRQVLERAAAWAAWHSKARNARGKVDVHYCRAAEVRKPRGVPAGTVELRRFHTVRVYPRAATVTDDS
ncbi:MAG TPA: NFACT RNA binding domain-containing protein [Longimicrobiales bacterium]|nr:NFACT RNA binding domain-containing protein [Longimicrobiales bacterium]